MNLKTKFQGNCVGLPLTLSLLAFVSNLSTAQITDTAVIYTGFIPRLLEVEKFKEQPSIKDTFSARPNMDYSLVPVAVKSNYDPDTISPAKMKSEPISKLHRIYLKAGFGNYMTPLVEVYLNSLRDKRNSYTINYRHFSSRGNISNRGFPGISDNEAGVSYQHFFRTHNLRLDGLFRRNVVHYYGYDPAVDSTIVSDSTQQYFNRFGFSGTLGSRYRTDSIKFNHQLGLNFYYLQDRYGTHETNAGLRFSIDKFTDKFAREFLGIALGAAYYNYRGAGSTASNGFFTDLTPYMRLGGNRWMVHLGVMFSLASDDSLRFNFYPDIKGHVDLVQKHLRFFVDLSGKYERQSFLRLTSRNPFLLSGPPLRNLNQNLLVNGGFSGLFSSQFSYRVGASFSFNRNFALFVNDTIANSQRRGFDVLFDNVNILTAFAEFSYAFGEKLSIALKGTYYRYYLSEQPHAWHQPDGEISLGARYNLRNKIIVKGDFFVISPSRARIFEADPANPGSVITVAKSLNWAMDLNLSGEYRITKSLSFFLQLNNIAAWRYNRWYQYPTQGLNLIGGVTLAL